MSKEDTQIIWCDVPDCHEYRLADGGLLHHAKVTTWRTLSMFQEDERGGHPYQMDVCGKHKLPKWMIETFEHNDSLSY